MLGQPEPWRVLCSRLLPGPGWVTSSHRCTGLPPAQSGKAEGLGSSETFHCCRQRGAAELVFPSLFRPPSHTLESSLGIQAQTYLPSCRAAELYASKSRGPGTKTMRKSEGKARPARCEGTLRRHQGGHGFPGHLDLGTQHASS